MPRKRYPRTLREPRSPEPHRCVLLAFDPGNTTGYCITVNGRPESWGAFSILDDVALSGVVAEFLSYAALEKLPMVTVSERWSSGGPHMNHSAVASLNAAWGTIRAALTSVSIPKSKQLRVYSATWNAVVFDGRAPTGETKSYASRIASAACGEVVTGDAADAVCVALWGSCSAEAWHALRKRERSNPTYEAMLRENKLRQVEYDEKQARKNALVVEVRR